MFQSLDKSILRSAIAGNRVLSKSRFGAAGPVINITPNQYHPTTDNKSVYRPALRDCSHVSGEFQVRKEVVSQFNYYNIIASFKI